MAFDQLSDRLQMALRRVTGKARLTENDIEEMMREVRLSLLEADVNFKVVKSFTKEVKEKSLDEKILKGLNPSQQVVKIVHDELKELLGGETSTFAIKSQGITTVMLSGLQGSGKTTTAGKLANYVRKHHKVKPLLVALDVYRPAAVDQLVTIGKQIDVPVFEKGIKESPVTIAKEALEYAKENNYNFVIFDTAGRLHIDDVMMEELLNIKEIISPDEILLVLDAMTGQDAVSVASHFHESLKITGSIITKLDGDTRGGAALSLRKVTEVPIKFMGLGEKLDQFDVFHPERMASRILGMGDVLTLIDKVTENIDEDDMMNMMEKMMSGKFNYNDFIKQLKMIKRMGSLGGILKLIPGAGKMMKNANVDDKQLVFIEAIIGSMTKKERKDPNLIKRSSSRRRRVAEGSGRSVAEVNKLIQSLDQQTQAMKRMSSMDPNSIDPNNPLKSMNQMQQPTKQKKGKGKNRGGFRF
ncbi:MAG: signal recognition particle protein [Candidatus Izemoplasmataceae bacterium]|jgi:signal recognition particle subunit SRP54|uniref:signal recognition particle protein n=1 Tax=Liberiplasma polymorphum TaxID=3374570 RepID=UPI0037738937